MEIHNKGTKRLFENPILERLTRTHIALPIGIFILYGMGLLYWSIATVQLDPLVTTGLFFGGLLFFSLLEYSIHRFLFHMSTHTSARKNFQYKFHGVHHDYPKDKDRLAMPPIVSVTISTILLFLFKLVIGDQVFAFLPGFLFGYAGYLFIHYLVHAYRPPKNFLKIFWVHHGIHHYRQGHKAFGVTSPLWDFVFRTMP